MGPRREPEPGPVALVTGATGAVGPAVVSRLVREGWRVRVLTRGLRPASWPEGSVVPFQGDVAERASVAQAMDGVAVVFHLAGLLHVFSPGPGLAAVYERVNVLGARIVAEEAVRAGVTRLVHFGTIAVYGPTGPAGADEDTPPRPDSPYGESKWRGEEAVREADGGAVILRLAAVYGPRVAGNYSRLARAIRSGWFVPVGPGRNRRTLVHEADVAEAALLAARSPRAAGRLYNVSDGCIHPLADVLEAIAVGVGRARPRVHLPLRPARAAAAAADAAARLLGLHPRLSPALDKLTEDVAVRAERIQDELGFRPRFDLRAGWADALRSRPG